MRVAILQHEPNEGIGSMQPWFEARGYTLHTTMVFLNQDLPKLEDFDWLLIMGGNMSVYEDEIYPWLETEKQLIRDAIDADKKVLGICLGGQLIANALGAEVYPGQHQEIGWFQVDKTDPIATWCPQQFTPLSWHGDRFELPEGATAFAKSDLTPNQGFSLNNKVWALQFHLEVTADSIPDFYEASGQKLPKGKFVQGYQQMIDNHHITDSKPVMYGLLDVMESA